MKTLKKIWAYNFDFGRFRVRSWYMPILLACIAYGIFVDWTIFLWFAAGLFTRMLLDW